MTIFDWRPVHERLSSTERAASGDHAAAADSLAEGASELEACSHRLDGCCVAAGFLVENTTKLRGDAASAHTSVRTRLRAEKETRDHLRGVYRRRRLAAGVQWGRNLLSRLGQTVWRKGKKG